MSLSFGLSTHLNAQNDPDCNECYYFEVNHFHEIAAHPFFGHKQRIQTHCITENTDTFFVASDGTAASEFELIRVSNSPTNCPPQSQNPIVGFIDENGEFVAPAPLNQYGKITTTLLTADHIKFLYTHPSDPPAADEKLRTLRIGIQYSFESFTFIEVVLTIAVYRPPVLMIHGLWSNAGSFKDMEDNLKAEKYESWQLQRMDYEPTNDVSFATNVPYVKNEINQLITAGLDSEVAVGQVDLVGHSMGGILSRLYCQQGNYSGDVRRIITCNTPHAGSQMGNVLLDNNYLFSDLFCQAISGLASLGSCYNGAVADLAVNSNAILNDLNGGNMPADIGVHSIVTTEQFTPINLNTSPILVTAAATFPVVISSTCVSNFLDNVFNMDDHDYIVSDQSQEGGLSGGTTTAFTGQIHMGATANQEVIDHVNNLLDEPANSASFSGGGYNPPVLNYNTPPLCFTDVPVDNRNTPTLSITAPTNGSEFNAGDIITVDVSGSPEVAEVILMLSQPPNHVWLAKETGPSPTFNLPIPLNALGHRTLVAIGLDSEGNAVVKTGGTEIKVNTTATLTDISIYPNKIFLENGNVAQIEIRGEFSDGIERDLSRLDETLFSFANDNASRNGNNGVHLDVSADDELTVQYLGISSVPVDIQHIAPMAALPIELSAFSAEPLDENKVLLNWTTTVEKEVKHFELERSVDGQHFSPIGRVASKSNSAVESHYDFIDQTRPSGWLYYRLKIVEFSGKSQYSAVQSIFIDGDIRQDFHLYPNPTQGQLFLSSLGQQQGIHTVRIFDLLGKKVMEQTLDFSLKNSVALNLKGLVSEGIYIVEINQGNVQKWKEKVLILPD